MTQLSTEQVARLLNVTVSTIKRWADEGLIACVKTPGGHRKFELAEATRIADEIIRPALVRIGAQWHEGLLEVPQEHEASGAITEALVRLAPELHRKPSNGLIAVCACVEGEHHEIGLRCMAFALELEGWKVHYVGANTPFDTFASFAKAMEPELICLSLSLTRHRKELADGMALIARAVRSRGTKTLVGGFRADSFSTADLHCDHIATTIGDGVSFVKNAFGLKPGPKRKETAA
jgi:excisionase family DNA binding protein